jgi:hypothetical protein
MKRLYLDRQQAFQLAVDLKDYLAMNDSSERDVFKGFRLQFGDLASDDIQHDDEMELTAIPNSTLIEGKDDE